MQSSTVLLYVWISMDSEQFYKISHKIWHQWIMKSTIFKKWKALVFERFWTRTWVRILNDVQLAIFRPWALLLHLVRPQLLRNHLFWCRRKEYNQGFQETYTLYTFTRFCTSHRPPNAKKWQKVMFLHFFIFLEPSCKFSSSITDII